MRIFRLLSKLVLLGFILTIIFTGTFVLKPEWILSPKVINFLIMKLGSSYQPSWTDLDVNIGSTTSWKTKKLSISARDLCVHSPEYAGCIDTLNLESEWSWPYPINILALKKLILKSNQFEIAEIESSSKETPSASFESIVSLLKKYRPSQWQDLQIEVQKIIWKDEEFSLHVNKDDKPTGKIAIQFQGYRKFKGHIDWLEDEAGQLLFSARLIRSDQVFNFEWKPNTLNSQTHLLKAWGESKKPKFSFTSEISFEFQDDIINLHGFAESSLANVQAKVSELSGKIKIEHSSEKLGGIELSGILSLEVNKKINSLLRFKTQASYSFNDHRVAVEIKNLDPNIKTDFRADCILNENDLGASLCDQDPEISFSLPYTQLVNLLQGSPYEIFAPFHVLKGVIEGRILLNKNLSKLHLELTTDLRSPKQRLDLNFDGEILDLFAVSPRAALSMILKDSVLQLPRIDPRNFPNLKLDSRIKIKNEKPKPKTLKAPPRINLKLRTENPLLIRTNLAVTAIPITIDLQIHEGLPSGILKAEVFSIKIFRREANVKRLQLNFRKGSSLAEIDGLIEYKTSNATIEIHLTGLASKPNIHFTSNPPLTQNEIISLLVFGRTSLAGDEAATAGNAQAAFASGAFGLASLYLFASTPIESIGYNSVTHSYSVRVKLPGGISAEYGSSFDQEQKRYLAFRRRLGKHFMLSTEWQNFSDSQSDSVDTFLQWFLRY